MYSNQQNNPTVVQMVLPVPVRQYSSLRHNSVIALSIVNVLLFIAVVILEILVITFGQGFWAGLMFLVTGSIGISCYRNPTHSLRTSLIVFSAISIAVAITAAILTGLLYCISGACYIWAGVQISEIVFYVVAILINLSLLIKSAKAKTTALPPMTLPQTAQIQQMQQQYLVASPTQVGYVVSGTVFTSGQVHQGMPPPPYQNAQANYPMQQPYFNQAQT